MGCCHSTPSTDETAEPTRQSRPINTSSSAAARSASTGSHQSVTYNAATITYKSSAHPNKPIRPPSPLATSPAHNPNLQPPWTRSQLETERTAYFDTRITGQQEIWNALRLVSELLQHENIEEAQAILDALNITTPNGRVAIGRGRDRVRGGLYDERGALYDLPAWVITDPQDLIEDDSLDSDKRQSSSSDVAKQNEKGKGRAVDIGEIVKIRARLSDRSEDLIVSIGTKEKVAAIVRKIQDRIGAKLVRLIYLGKVLDERNTLEAQGYRAGDVLNAFVFVGPDEFMRGDVKMEKTKE